jgi:hypothetical protein
MVGREPTQVEVVPEIIDVDDRWYGWKCTHADEGFETTYPNQVVLAIVDEVPERCRYA